MPISENKKASNARYTEKCDYINVRPLKAQGQKIRAAAAAAAMRQAGIAYATEQIIDLVANGVSHVHIYTMNKPDVAGAIFANLSEIYQHR